MRLNETIKLTIRNFEVSDSEEIISIWKQCGLIRSWNNPYLDIKRKLLFQGNFFFVGELGGTLIATAMFGYEGHRGWLNYFAVLPKFQKQGFGKQMLVFGEGMLIKEGCPKLNLQIRSNNIEVINFYKACGYKVDATVSLSKRLIKD